MGKYFGTDGFRGEANVDLTWNMRIKSEDFSAGIMENRPRETTAES